MAHGVRLWPLAGFFILCCLVVRVADAQAPNCGFPRCEAYIQPNPKVYPTYKVTYECREGTGASADKIQVWYQSCTNSGTCGAWVYSGTSFPKCQCGAVAPQVGGSISTNGSGLSCKNGCEFECGDGVCVTLPDLPKGDGAFVTFGDSFVPTGNQCNAGPGNGGPSSPNCDDDTCLDWQPPKLCAETDGNQVCTNPGECGGGQMEGYVCVGSPESPPRPPDPPVPESAPPDVSHPCVVNGQPCEIDIHQPPYDERPCPAGSHREDGNCVADAPQVCPDGTRPVNGECPAPWGNCADGTRPVNGRCPPDWEDCPDGSRPVQGVCDAQGGVCPDGSIPFQGQCAAETECPDGSEPQDGTCQAPWGNCPNGSPPVNGQCGAGQACDPATDPQQCQGNENNAGGGGTCDAEPFCSGDLILCNVLAQQWRTRCAIENFGSGEITTDGTTGASGEDEAGVREVDGSGLLSQLTEQSFLGGGSCPQFPAFTALGATYSFSEWEGWCTFLDALAGIIYFMGSFMAVRILLGD